MAQRLAIACPSAHLVGGVQSWLDTTVAGLESTGWTVTVHLPQGRWSNAQAYARAHGLERHARMFENPTGSHEGRIRALADSLAAAEPDLVLGVNLVDVYAAVDRLRARGSNPRLAIALHGLHAGPFEDLRRWAPVVDAAISTNRLGVRAAQAVAGLPPERTFYAPCGMDIGPMPSMPPHGADALRLIFVGRFDEAEKRVSDLPRIARELDRAKVPFTLTLAGAGPQEQQLRRELSAFGERVEFAGLLSAAELAARIYRPGSVLLITSPSETGPLVAWEAMAHGVAVVTSRFVGLQAEGALQDGRTCLTFPVGDAAAAAQCVARLQDHALLCSLARQGWETVSARYSRAASLQAWDRALRSVLAMHAQSDIRPRPRVPVSGRLDRWLGVGRAEQLRRLLGISYAHACAGDEWPHTYAMHPPEEIGSRIRQLDLQP